MNFKEIKKVLWTILVLNWLVAFTKIFLGFFTGTLSILADGFHSLFDGLSNIAGLLGIRLAKKPDDESHPYGYLKYEPIAAMIILAFLVFTALELCKGVYERLLKQPQSPEITWLVISVLVACLVIDYLVARYEYKKGRELKSTILVADSQHTKSHYITTGAVIIGAILIRLGLPPIVDPIITIFVIGFFGNLIYKIFKETSAILSDKAVIEKARIEKIVKTVEGVRSCHKIRSRGPEAHIFLDIHIVLDPNLILEKAHQISHLVKEKIKQEIPEVKDIIIHIEPEDNEE